MRKGSIQEAIEKLAAGEVVGFPTETVYGLAGRMDQIKAIEKIFSVKKRPFFEAWWKTHGMPLGYDVYTV